MKQNCVLFTLCAVCLCALSCEDIDFIANILDSDQLATDSGTTDADTAQENSRLREAMALQNFVRSNSDAGTGLLIPPVHLPGTEVYFSALQGAQYMPLTFGAVTFPSAASSVFERGGESGKTLAYTALSEERLAMVRDVNPNSGQVEFVLSIINGINGNNIAEFQLPASHLARLPVLTTTPADELLVAGLIDTAFIFGEGTQSETTLANHTDLPAIDYFAWFSSEGEFLRAYTVELPFAVDDFFINQNNAIFAGGTMTTSVRTDADSGESLTVAVIAKLQAPANGIDVEWSSHMTITEAIITMQQQSNIRLLDDNREGAYMILDAPGNVMFTAVDGTDLVYENTDPKFPYSFWPVHLDPEGGVIWNWHFKNTASGYGIRSFSGATAQYGYLFFSGNITADNDDWISRLDNNGEFQQGDAFIFAVGPWSHDAGSTILEGQFLRLPAQIQMPTVSCGDQTKNELVVTAFYTEDILFDRPIWTPEGITGILPKREESDVVMLRIGDFPIIIE